METSRKRIIDFIENQHIKPKDFLEKTGLKKGFIDRSHQDSGASDIYLSKILEVYPNISAEWLLTGKGPMLKSEVTPVISETDKAYKELAEARLDIIDGLKYKIAALEKTISDMRMDRAETFLHANVAEPAPELIGKKHK